MTRTRRLKSQAALVVGLGAFALATPHRAEARGEIICWSSCIDAVMNTNCPFPLISECRVDSYNCPWFPDDYVGICEGGS